MQGGTISIREISRVLGVSEKEARQLVTREKLPISAISKNKFVVSRSAFNEWEKKRSQAPVTP